MSNAEMTEYMMRLHVAQFRAVKRAVTVLVRGGMHLDEAIKIVLVQHRENRRPRN